MSIGAVASVAEQRRDELRKKLKRERELEEAEAKAAAAEAESYGEGGGDVPISRVGRQNSRSLFAAAEQSLSSFSVWFSVDPPIRGKFLARTQKSLKWTLPKFRDISYQQISP